MSWEYFPSFEFAIARSRKHFFMHVLGASIELTANVFCVKHSTLFVNVDQFWCNFASRAHHNHVGGGANVIDVGDCVYLSPTSLPIPAHSNVCRPPPWSRNWWIRQFHACLYRIQSISLPLCAHCVQFIAVSLSATVIALSPTMIVPETRSSQWSASSTNFRLIILQKQLASSFPGPPLLVWVFVYVSLSVANVTMICAAEDKRQGKDNWREFMQISIIFLSASTSLSASEDCGRLVLPSPLPLPWSPNRGQQLYT